MEDAEAWEGERLDLGKIEEAMIGRVGVGWSWEVDLKRELEKAKAVFGRRRLGSWGFDTEMDGRYMMQVRQSFLSGT